MKRTLAALPISVALVLSATVPVLASEARTTLWVCDVPDVGRVVFVTAAEAARHGIDVANAHAGATFSGRFGETCTVE